MNEEYSIFCKVEETINRSLNVCIGRNIPYQRSVVGKDYIRLRQSAAPHLH